MDKKSLTLVEIVVALAILSACVTGLFASFVAGKKYTARSKRRIIALNCARQVAESLKSFVRGDTYNSEALACGNSPSGSPCTVNLPSAFININLPAELYGATAKYDISNIAIDPADPDNPNKWMRKVTITVTWNEPTS
jgi:type II secretory pathway pseudopilin PulG